MDESLYTEFWLKNYDEVQGHGRYDQWMMREEVAYAWHKFKQSMEDPDQISYFSQNTIDCINAIMDAWTYKNVIAEW